METDEEICPHCDGTGYDPNHNGADCSHCEGSGRVAAICEWCDSALDDANLPCPNCLEEARANYESGLRADSETELVPLYDPRDIAILGGDPSL